MTGRKEKVRQEEGEGEAQLASGCPQEVVVVVEVGEVGAGGCGRISITVRRSAAEAISVALQHAAGLLEEGSRVLHRLSQERRLRADWARGTWQLPIRGWHGRVGKRA